VHLLLIVVIILLAFALHVFKWHLNVMVTCHSGVSAVEKSIQSTKFTVI